MKTGGKQEVKAGGKQEVKTGGQNRRSLSTVAKYVQYFSD